MHMEGCCGRCCGNGLESKEEKQQVYEDEEQQRKKCKQDKPDKNEYASVIKCNTISSKLLHTKHMKKSFDQTLQPVLVASAPNECWKNRSSSLQEDHSLWKSEFLHCQGLPRFQESS